MRLKQKQPHISTRENTQGFTIVELMIATLVFSTILLVITVGVLKFTSAYYKGVNASATQSTARTIADTVGQAVQFGTPAVTESSTTPGPLYVSANKTGLFCAGGYAFVYSHTQYTGLAPSLTNAGVYMMKMPTGACDIATIPSLTGGQEMLSKGMRVTDIRLVENGTSGVYSFNVTVAYGDSDLLCIVGDATAGCGTGGATPSDLQLRGQNTKVSCRTGAGNEYCAVVTLNTSIKKRVGS